MEIEAIEEYEYHDPYQRYHAIVLMSKYRGHRLYAKASISHETYRETSSLPLIRTMLRDTLFAQAEKLRPSTIENATFQEEYDRQYYSFEEIEFRHREAQQIGAIEPRRILQKRVEKTNWRVEGF